MSAKYVEGAPGQKLLLIGEHYSISQRNVRSVGLAYKPIIVR